MTIPIGTIPIRHDVRRTVFASRYVKQNIRCLHVLKSNHILPIDLKISTHIIAHIQCTLQTAALVQITLYMLPWQPNIPI